MKVIKQLAEDEFVVKMDEKDLDTTESFIVAHDYVMFSDNMGIMTCSDRFEGKLTGKFKGGASNWIRCRSHVQIGIREMVDVVLPKLSQHEYCQQNHLFSDGKPCYIYDEGKIRYYENGKEMIAIRKRNSTEYIHIDKDTYDAIKNGEI